VKRSVVAARKLHVLPNIKKPLQGEKQDRKRKRLRGYE
jgi:hypothetical protein